MVISTGFLPEPDVEIGLKSNDIAIHIFDDNLKEKIIINKAILEQISIQLTKYQ
jgi:hypothetical protein